jgi:hypothetical protein
MCDTGSAYRGIAAQEGEQVNIPRALHRADCTCSVCHQVTIDAAEAEGMARYRAMKGMAQTIADADRRSQALARLELSLCLTRRGCHPRVRT